jgi:hypothetical protein
MSRKTIQTAGILFILGALLVNVPYTLLIVNFDYPDILTQEPGFILTQFAQGGGFGGQTPLVWTWLAFAWAEFPILIGIILLGRWLEEERPESAGWARVGTALGVLAILTQMVGLARWVFVVPHLAAMYTDPAATDATRAAAEAAFVVIHRFGGNVMGEHLGQLFTIGWMAATSGVILRTRVFPAWVGYFGWAASAVYLLAQTELLSAVTNLPLIPEAGLVGSLLCLAWIVALGALTLRRPGALALQPA